MRRVPGAVPVTGPLPGAAPAMGVLRDAAPAIPVLPGAVRGMRSLPGEGPTGGAAALRGATDHATTARVPRGAIGRGGQDGARQRQGIVSSCRPP